MHTLFILCYNYEQKKNNYNNIKSGSSNRIYYSILYVFKFIVMERIYTIQEKMALMAGETIPLYCIQVVKQVTKKYIKVRMYDGNETQIEVAKIDYDKFADGEVLSISDFVIVKGESHKGGCIYRALRNELNK